MQFHTQVTQPLVLMKRHEGFRTPRYQKLRSELLQNIKEKKRKVVVQTAPHSKSLQFTGGVLLIAGARSST